MCVILSCFSFAVKAGVISLYPLEILKPRENAVFAGIFTGLNFVFTFLP
jgi:hypothetical protein